MHIAFGQNIAQKRGDILCTFTHKRDDMSTDLDPTQLAIEFYAVIKPNFLPRGI